MPYYLLELGGGVLEWSSGPRLLCWCLHRHRGVGVPQGLWPHSNNRTSPCTVPGWRPSPAPPPPCVTFRLVVVSLRALDSHPPPLGIAAR